MYAAPTDIEVTRVGESLQFRGPKGWTAVTPEHEEYENMFGSARRITYRVEFYHDTHDGGSTWLAIVNHQAPARRLAEHVAHVGLEAYCHGR